MSLTLRILLIIISVISFILCVMRIKQSKLKIENSVVWMTGSILLILMSIFVDAVDWVSKKLGFMAPVNFVFLSVIIFLLIQTFINNIKMSLLNEKIKDLNHYIALQENKNKKEEK
ncbi:MAG: DUF2304 domain-containing protein [Clostridia bacterium]|nr:DUF2304 domain-containing protein [Clostridia bacterium]